MKILNKNIKSIGVIVDGNRRWAVENKLKKTAGHKEGLKKIFEFIDWSKKRDIENITFYVFSMENWNRTKIEVMILMKLFEEAFKKNEKKIIEKKVAVKFIGSFDKISKKLQKIMTEIERKTKNNKMKIFFALSYGGRDEIVQAVKKIIKEKVHYSKINNEKIEKYLQSYKIPDPELIIRTGGAKRLSNFLLWKTAYSELFFIDKKWPEISEKDFDKIIEEYYNNTIINHGV